MKKLFSTIVISALLCVNTFATPVVVNSEPATFEKPVIIRQSTSFLSLREIASNLLDNVNLQWNAEKDVYKRQTTFYSKCISCFNSFILFCTIIETGYRLKSL